MKRRIAWLFLLALFLLSCDAEKLFKKAPVIDSVELPERVNQQDTVYARVTATNPEKDALSYHWFVNPDGGVFIDPADGAETRWIARTGGGDYTFTIKVSNSYKSTEKSKIVKVIETGLPSVKIQKPQANAYWIQMHTYSIEVQALHGNGISKVMLYVNDEFQKENSISQNNIYQFTFAPDTSLLGPVKIKAEAIANTTSARAADSVMVTVEGIIPGRYALP